MNRIIATFLVILGTFCASAQINTDQVIRVGRNALYFEDYVLSIQYFNQAIASKPWLAKPYFYRALAKYNLDDWKGAEEDASEAIERNPFITDAYELRGVVRQYMGRLPEAIADYDKALSMLPENRGLLSNKAIAQEEMKDYEGARQSYATLLKLFPGYEYGYIGRARLNLADGDTVAALADVDKALSINRNIVNAYLIRADVAIGRKNGYEQALKDMDEAIRLQPHSPGLYINRAFLRHQTDDYFGAMSDYDYAIELDPANYVGYYNRALLRAEVHDFDRAIDDLDQVLSLRGVDYRTLYNRAVLYRERRQYKEALADANKVIEGYPSLAAGYFLRSDILRSMGKSKEAEADYQRSLALAKERVQKVPDGAMHGETAERDSGSEGDNLLAEDSEPQEVVAARFSSLITLQNNARNNVSMDQDFNTKNIRGRVQDRNMAIEVEPMFVVSYYTSPTELKPNSDYMREVDILNHTRALRFLLQLTNHEPAMTDATEIKRHFESIDYYNSYLSTHTPRAIDYFGRGMDFMTVRNYKSAIEDFTRATELSPDFTLAFFMRSIARHREMQSIEENAMPTRATISEIIADIDQVIKLSPDMALAHYNKGVLLTEIQDYTSALSSFNSAIALRSDFGEAYYNRGYCYFKLGNRTSGTSDLSKAGELGVVPSYNLLKRMSNN